VTRAAVLALLGLLALITGAVVSGCGTGPLPEGPLGKNPENHDVVGQPVLSGGADTIGFDALFNPGPAPAVIDRLVIVSPRHIKLTGAYVTLGGPVGNWATFPPSFPTSASGRHENRYLISRWARRHIPAGAVIPPHQWAGIALGLHATAAHGSIAATDLYYHVGSAHYEWRGHIRIVLTSVNCRAPFSASAQNFCRAVERERRLLGRPLRASTFRPSPRPARNSCPATTRAPLATEAGATPAG
jgi:hypothetical protein